MGIENKWTGEWLETLKYSYDIVDHLNRYTTALEFVINKTFVDIAYGEGYGESIIVEIVN